MDLNRVTLIGRLGRDPIQVTTKTGTSMCILKIATSEMRKLDTGAVSEQTEWHDIIVFGKPAEHCLKYLFKGREVWVEGKLEYKNRLYKGVQIRDVNIVANTVGFLGKTTKQPASTTVVESQEEPMETLEQESENHISSIKQESSTTGKDPVNTSFSTLLQKGLEDDDSPF